MTPKLFIPWQPLLTTLSVLTDSSIGGGCPISGGTSSCGLGLSSLFPTVISISQGDKCCNNNNICTCKEPKFSHQLMVLYKSSDNTLPNLEYTTFYKSNPLIEKLDVQPGL